MAALTSDDGPTAELSSVPRQEMKKSGVAPNLFTYNVLVNACAKANCPRMAQEVVGEIMPRAGIEVGQGKLCFSSAPVETPGMLGGGAEQGAALELAIHQPLPADPIARRSVSSCFAHTGQQAPATGPGRGMEWRRWSLAGTWRGCKASERPRGDSLGRRCLSEQGRHATACCEPTGKGKDMQGCGG